MWVKLLYLGHDPFSVDRNLKSHHVVSSLLKSPRGCVRLPPVWFLEANAAHYPNALCMTPRPAHMYKGTGRVMEESNSTGRLFDKVSCKHIKALVAPRAERSGAGAAPPNNLYFRFLIPLG